MTWLNSKDNTLTWLNSKDNTLTCLNFKENSKDLVNDLVKLQRQHADFLKL